MPVSRVQCEIVLEHEGGEPHIVRWNGRALLAQLTKNRCIVMRRLVVGIQNVHAVLEEKTSKRMLVLDLPAPQREAGAQLPEHDERQHDGFGLLEQLDGLGNSPTEIDVPVRVNGDSHRQSASSTWS